jgi:hypothetical protein
MALILAVMPDPAGRGGIAKFARAFQRQAPDLCLEWLKGEQRAVGYVSPQRTIAKKLHSRAASGYAALQH